MTSLDSNETREWISFWRIIATEHFGKKSKVYSAPFSNLILKSFVDSAQIVGLKTLLLEKCLKLNFEYYELNFNVHNSFQAKINYPPRRYDALGKCSSIKTA